MSNKNKSTLSFKERVAVHDKLRDSLIVDEAAGTCQYKEGLTDASVAAELRCTAANVYSVRQEMFGKLRHPSRTEAASVRDEQLRTLTERLELHESKLDATYQLLMRVAADSKFQHLREAVRLRELFAELGPALRG